MTAPGEVTRILNASRRGSAPATERLLELVYDELRQIADAQMNRERGNHTLQPTALVHEAYLRLVYQQDASFKSRAHFVAVASGVIRRILIDHARRRAAGKRGGGIESVQIDESVPVFQGEVDLLALHEAMERLGELNERQQRIVELRYFGGLTIDETARVLQVSPATVKAEWAMARAWLRMQLKD